MWSILALLGLSLCATALADTHVHELAVGQPQHFRVYHHKSNQAVIFSLCDSERCGRLTVEGWRRSGKLQYEGRSTCELNGRGGCFLASQPGADAGFRYPERPFDTAAYDFVVERQHHPKRLGSRRYTMVLWMRDATGDVAEVPVPERAGRLTIEPQLHNNMTVEWVNPGIVMAENSVRNGVNRFFGWTTTPPPTTTSRRRLGRVRVTTTTRRSTWRH
ncbi:hypothetical protein ONE63_007287 [Megalurothrips usitatus]|uniref:Uncharacterized protein n=1 Tax=Megalurothrips usitatus TaxID=439358 RepID=A0AAV7XSM4_9NEOP|nr:hypothetical protein ONE63_007287 [Megalurothrips usitatus]